MGYNQKAGFLDLMFPDFTYFGHEYSQIVGERLSLAASTTMRRAPCRISRAQQLPALLQPRDHPGLQPHWSANLGLSSQQSRSGVRLPPQTRTAR